MNQSPTGEYINIRRILDNTKIDEITMPLEEFRLFVQKQAELGNIKRLSPKVKMFLLKV